MSNDKPYLSNFTEQELQELAEFDSALDVQVDGSLLELGEIEEYLLVDKEVLLRDTYYYKNREDVLKKRSVRYWQNPAKSRQDSLDYYYDHRDELLEKRRVYQKQYLKEYRKRNKERLQAYGREASKRYKQENRQRCNEYSKIWMREYRRKKKGSQGD